MRQKEARMGKQQGYRWIEQWGPFLSSNSSSCSVKSWEPWLSVVMWCTNPLNWSIGRNVLNQKKMSSKDRAPTSEKLKGRNRIKLWRIQNQHIFNVFLFTFQVVFVIINRIKCSDCFLIIFFNLLRLFYGQLIGTSSSWVIFVRTRKSCIRITGRNCIMTWISMACKH